MASPQTENGFIRIANEIIEALAKTRINGEARQVLDAIFRKTYGYNKKEDCISLTQFSSLTGLKKPTICKALSKLKLMNIITQKGNAIANSYSIQKDFSFWKPLPKKVTLPKKVKSITQKGNLPLPKKIPTIDILTKDNNKRQKQINFKGSGEQKKIKFYKNTGTIEISEAQLEELKKKYGHSLKFDPKLDSYFLAR